MKCIRCDKEVIEIDKSDKPEQGMWLDGVVDRVTAGYGSSLDMDSFIVCVCDNCIKDKCMEDGYIKDYGWNK